MVARLCRIEGQGFPSDECALSIGVGSDGDNDTLVRAYQAYADAIVEGSLERKVDPEGDHFSWCVFLEE